MHQKPHKSHVIQPRISISQINLLPQNQLVIISKVGIVRCCTLIRIDWRISDSEPEPRWLCSRPSENLRTTSPFVRLAHFGPTRTTHRCTSASACFLSSHSLSLRNAITFSSSAPFAVQFLSLSPGEDHNHRPHRAREYGEWK